MRIALANVLLLFACPVPLLNAQESNAGLAARVQQLERRLDRLENRPYPVEVGIATLTIETGKTEARAKVNLEQDYPKPPVVLIGELGPSRRLVSTKTDDVSDSSFYIVVTRTDSSIDSPYRTRIGYAVFSPVGPQFDALQVGKTYRIFRKVGMLSQLAAADIPFPASLKEMTEIPSGSLIKVTQIRRRDGVIWYEVTAEREGRSFGQGWISSRALKDQDNTFVR